MEWWAIALIAAGGLILAGAAVGVVAGLYAARKIFCRRYDGNPNLRYFQAEDFEGLKAEPVSFGSGDATLRGYIYSYDGDAKGAVIFSHGFGAGHTSYTTEIARLASFGYKVLAFDNTGCMESGGDTLVGFDRGVADLLAAAEFAEKDVRLKAYKKAFVGHSWGGFSVMNAFPSAKNVCCAVAMCGFDGAARVLAQNVFGRFAPLRAVMAWTLMLYDRAVFGKCANYRSSRSLKNIKKPVLLLYGKKDMTVRYRWNGKKILSALSGNSFVRSEVYEEKGHNVYLTCEAEALMHETFEKIGKAARRDKASAAKMYADVDYAAITKEDDSVMGLIGEFLRSHLS